MTTLVIIDPQVDFVSGSLAIPGAEKAMEWLSEWIKKNNPFQIIVTLDTHHPGHIGLPGAWNEEFNNLPKQVTAKEVEEDIYTLKTISKHTGLMWLKYIEGKGRIHTVWPNHCLLGSVGNAVCPVIHETLTDWELRNNRVEYIIKGIDNYREEYSAYTQEMINLLDNQSNIFIAGLAKDICVSETINDILDSGKYNESNITLLEKGMAAVNTESAFCKKVFKRAKENGWRIV